MPDVSKWIKSQFYTNSWTLASDVKKSQFSHSYCRLTFMPRLHLNFQNHNFTPVFDGWPSFGAKGLCRASPNLHFATCLDVRPARSLKRVARAQKKFTFHHMFGRSKRTISADGCCGQRSFAFHHTTCLPIRHAPSPQRVARTNKTRISPHVWVSDTPQRVTIRKPAWVSLPPERNRRTGEVRFCRSSDTIWTPGS